MPVIIVVSHKEMPIKIEESCKKIESNVDSCAGFSEKRYRMI